MLVMNATLITFSAEILNSTQIDRKIGICFYEASLCQNYNGLSRIQHKFALDMREVQAMVCINSS